MTVQRSSATAKAQPKKADKDTRLEFDLSNGDKVVIRQAKGYDAERAMRFAGSGQQDKYMSALMSYTVTVNGKPIIPEALTDMPLKDYLKIQGEFADLNF
jgi:hypothetical protein